MTNIQWFAFSGTVLGCMALPAQAETRRPNVVFILADDLGYMDIGANNPQTFYETPNINRLAAQGMRFTDGYAACPVCSPTRASILTGKISRTAASNKLHWWRQGGQAEAATVCRPFGVGGSDDSGNAERGGLCHGVLWQVASGRRGVPAGISRLRREYGRQWFRLSPLVFQPLQELHVAGRAGRRISNRQADG